MFTYPHGCLCFFKIAFEIMYRFKIDCVVSKKTMRSALRRTFERNCVGRFCSQICDAETE